MVCHACINDGVLAEEVKVNGIVRPCSYCGGTRDAVALNTLANRIHEILQDHFSLTPNDPEEPHEFYRMSRGEWEPRGDLAREVIAEIAGLEPDVAADVDELLRGSSYTYYTVKDGGPYPYGYEAFYEEREPEEEEVEVS